MLLDTADTLSEITPEAADAMHLSRRLMHIRHYNRAGEYSKEAVDVGPFQLGVLSTPSIELVVSPSQHLFGKSGDQIVGILAPNVLMKYDVDVDFGSGKLNLISPDHCEGKVIYWPAKAIAVVPIKVEGTSSRVSEQGKIIIPVTIDGQHLDALLDTGAAASVLDREAAESNFGLKMGSADTPYAHDMFGKPGVAVYRHKFQSLDFEGIAIQNLDIDILPNFATGQLSMGPDVGSRLAASDAVEVPELVIGMNVLRHLHLYISYAEKKLYITPAGSPPANPPMIGVDEPSIAVAGQ